MAVVVSMITNTAASLLIYPLYYLDSVVRGPRHPGPGLHILVVIFSVQGAAHQGGDTRREEVLSKVLVDISIHTTSHASDTAQNKLCSFWMGPVLLWSVIN